MHQPAESNGWSKSGCHRYLYRPPPADHRLLVGGVIHPGRTMTVRAEPPTAVDHRPLLRPVRNQLQAGSCSGFATEAFKEHECAVWGGGKVPLGADLSPAYLYGWTRIVEGTFPKDCGASIADEMAILNARGVCPESFLPYRAEPADEPTPAADVAALPYRCGVPCVVDKSDPADIRAVLQDGKCIVIGVACYQSFEDVGPGGELKMPDPAREGLLGGHALLVVGYREDGAWIVRNSWGSGWADGGYGYMPSQYRLLWAEAWTTLPEAR